MYGDTDDMKLWCGKHVSLCRALGSDCKRLLQLLRRSTGCSSSPDCSSSGSGQPIPAWALPALQPAVGVPLQ